MNVSSLNTNWSIIETEWQEKWDLEAYWIMYAIVSMVCTNVFAHACLLICMQLQ